jgi:glycosyltransferase involved in cell wall biosynthesis
MAGNRLLFLRETWFWMGSMSGFDPFISAVEALPGVVSTSIWVPDKIPPVGLWERIHGRLTRPSPAPRAPSPFTAHRHEWITHRVLSAMSAFRDAVGLLSAGENQYGGVFSSAVPEIRSRLVVCFHQPPSWWRLHWRDVSLLNGLKAIVCLCQEQQDYFTALSSTPVIMLRHGVLHDFFTPDFNRLPGSPRLLFVGHWLRDLDVLEMAMNLIWQSRPDIELDCLIPIHARDHPVLTRLAGNSRIHWHSGLSPEQVRELYRQATLLFLPFIDAAANNGIVEALACGLPIVSTRVGGIPDYVPDDCGRLCAPGDAKDHACAVIDLINNKELLDRKKRACRRHAERTLNWKDSAQLFHDFLASLK